MDDLEGRLGTAKRLADALDQGQFMLFCQPIVPLAGNVPRQRHFEIFVRFREEEDKLLPPGSFFPVLLSYRLTSMLDRWVVSEVLNWSRGKLDANPGWAVPRFSINLADESINDANFPGIVRDELVTANIRADRISFEIADEQVAQHSRDVLKRLAAFKEMGCPATLANFAGSTAPAVQFRNSGIEYIKLSREVVRRAARDDEGYARLVELNKYCTDAGIRTVAEFVEEDAMVELLRRAGVNFAQGYLFAHPSPLSEVD